MAHLAFVSPPYLGHLNPMGALARELLRRGHRVTFAGIADAEAVSPKGDGIGFAALGRDTHPPGTLPAMLRRIAAADGLLGIPAVIRDVADMTACLLRDLPPLLRGFGADAIVCDGVEAAGGLVAAHLGLPLITVANALPLNREPGMPPAFTGWRYDPSTWGLERNRGGYRVADLLMRRHERLIAAAAERWRLGPKRNVADCLSPLAQLSQMVPGLDYPRRELPHHFHYIGPLRDPPVAEPSGFALPADDGRPLVYASLGTLFGSRLGLFRRIVGAARRLDLRLIIAHGGALPPAQAAELAGGGAHVHAFVPQDIVLSAASAAILNCGLNTVLDALASAVPVVALPIAFEQDAIAARIALAGAGVRVGRWSRSPYRIGRALEKVLGEPIYRRAAAALAAEVAGAGGVLVAADIVEEALRTGRPVLRSGAAADQRPF